MGLQWCSVVNFLWGYCVEVTSSILLFCPLDRGDPQQSQAILEVTLRLIPGFILEVDPRAS